MSHVTADLVPALEEAVNDAYQPVREDVRLRPRAEVLAMLDGLELVPPGLAWVSDWRPEKDTPLMDAEQMIYAAVGRKP
jgi:S-adenosyl methyltransferase